MSTSVLDAPQVEELYRSLEEKVRALRPNEDLEPLHRAYLFAAERHQNQKRKSGEPYITHPDCGRKHPGRHADGLGLPADRPAARRGRRHRRQARRDQGSVRRRCGALRGRRHQAEQDQPGEPGRPAGRKPPQDAAGDDGRYSRHHRQTGRPAAQHADDRLAVARSGRMRLRRKRSISMRPSRTGSGWARCAASWRIWRSRRWSRRLRPS